MADENHADITGERKIAQPTESSPEHESGLVEIPDAIRQAREAAVPPSSVDPNDDPAKKQEKDFLDSIRMELLQDLHKMGKESKSEHVRLQAKLRLLDEQGDKPAARQPKDDDDDIPGSIFVPEA